MPYQGNFQVIWVIIFLSLNISFWTATGSGGMHRRSLISSSLKMICKEIFQVSLVSCMNWPGLSFEYNRISGAIPSSLFNISSLQILKARHNYLNGHLPYDLGTWLPNLQEIFLSHNQFSGDLPSAICNASKLENLEVANDSFTGPIPMMLGNLVDLITLNLQNNLLENKPGVTQLDFLNSLVSQSFF